MVAATLALSGTQYVRENFSLAMGRVMACGPVAVAVAAAVGAVVGGTAVGTAVGATAFVAAGTAVGGTGVGTGGAHAARMAALVSPNKRKKSRRVMLEAFIGL